MILEQGANYVLSGLPQRKRQGAVILDFIPCSMCLQLTDICVVFLFTLYVMDSGRELADRTHDKCVIFNFTPTCRCFWITSAWKRGLVHVTNAIKENQFEFNRALPSFYYYFLNQRYERNILVNNKGWKGMRDNDSPRAQKHRNISCKWHLAKWFSHQTRQKSSPNDRLLALPRSSKKNDCSSCHIFLEPCSTKSIHSCKRLSFYQQCLCRHGRDNQRRQALTVITGCWAN